jgi:hypothetical protein
MLAVEMVAVMVRGSIIGIKQVAQYPSSVIFSIRLGDRAATYFTH